MSVDQAFIERHTTEITLRNGTRVLLRPIVPEDKDALAEAFARLSPESRYRRFFSQIDELTPEMLRRLTEIDYRDHFAWVAMAIDEPGQPGAGVARYVRVADEPEIAEAAVTVVDDFQGRGLGRLLLQMLGAIAIKNGIKRFRGYVLEDNQAIRKLLEGAEVHHESPGLLRVEVDLPARADELRASPIYEVLRAIARGEGPRFRPPDPSTRRGTE